MDQTVIAAIAARTYPDLMRGVVAFVLARTPTALRLARTRLAGHLAWVSGDVLAVAADVTVEELSRLLGGAAADGLEIHERLSAAELARLPAGTRMAVELAQAGTRSAARHEGLAWDTPGFEPPDRGRPRRGGGS